MPTRTRSRGHEAACRDRPCACHGATGSAYGRALCSARRLTRRKMQEELLALWDDVRFTLLFVTHSIEEALVVGNRIALLSPHPGRMRAELNSHEWDLSSAAARSSRPRRTVSIGFCSKRPMHPREQAMRETEFASSAAAARPVPPIRAEYELPLEALAEASRPLELPLHRRLWQHALLRKSVILVCLALIWEIVARLQETSFCFRLQRSPEGACRGYADRRHSQPGGKLAGSAAQRLCCRCDPGIRADVAGSFHPDRT